MKRHITYLIIATALFILSTSAVFAQLDLTETYTSPDGTWKFDYPDGWVPELAEDTGLVFLTGEGANMLFFGPDFLTEFELDSVKSQEELIETLAPLLDYEATDMNTGTTEDGRAFAVTDLIGQEETSTLGFALELGDGNNGAVFAELTDDSQEAFDTVIQVVLSFSAADGESPTETTGKLDELENFGGEWQDAVAELEESGMIGAGGELVFFEDYAFFTGQGRYFTALARNNPRTDIVMAGELTYTASDASDLESCTLLSRIVTNTQGNAEQFLQVGLTNQDAVLYLDRFGANQEEFTGDLVPLAITSGEPNHFMMLVIDDTMTVYLNGELFLEDVEVIDRGGTFGIALTGQGAGARCEGRNIWVYDAPTFAEGICEITSAGTVNTRLGPGTSFERGDSLSTGTIALATGQTEGSDGFIWWELDSGSWVRDDVISARGDCANVPPVTELTK